MRTNWEGAKTLAGRSFPSFPNVNAKKVNDVGLDNRHARAQTQHSLIATFSRVRASFVFATGPVVSALAYIRRRVRSCSNMPTYHACGVTARLTTCDLRPTLSGFTDLRMGGEQRKDALRIQKELSGGEKLGERPIGSDGSESGVVQFVGKHGDIPLFVVEASEHLRKKRPPAQKALLAKQRISGSPSDSSLTSLGATPDSTQEAFLSTAQATEATVPKPQARSKTKTKPQVKSQTALPLEQHTLEQALRSAHENFGPDQQALVLEVELGQESFLPTRNLSASLGKDLKIEIFVNGELAEVSFINARRSAAQVVGDKIRFAGTRVHRQVSVKQLKRQGSGFADFCADREAMDL